MTRGDAFPEEIVVRGAREHNLRNIDVRIPRDRLVVITGLSGSGKSSLAFDTLYAEGQRRYVESLSAYARQFLDQLGKPDVDSIEGLSPAIAIEQKTAGRNPRSTVGTTTEIADYLRLLFARAGEPHCPECGKPIASQTVQQMTDRVLSLGEGARLEVLAPIVRDRKGEYRKELDQLRRQGYVRARIDGESCELGDEIRLKKSVRHDIEVVVDRLAAKESARGRIAEAIETALRLADGLAILDVGPGRADIQLSRRSACVDCGISLPEIAPRMFSFNSPHGACSGCGGLGTEDAFDPALVVPDSTLSLSEGAIAPWSARGAPRYYKQLLAALAGHYGISLADPWDELPARARRGIIEGGEDVVFEFERGGKHQSFRRSWDGLLGELARRFERAGENERERLARYRSPHTCPACEGSRLRPEARAVRIAGASISDVTALPIHEAGAWIDGLSLDEGQRQIAERVVGEIRERLQFLEDVGLEYLSLDRASATLSGGEAQRSRLATQVGSSLMGVLYILDEPSIGLHPRDNRRLLRSLEKLRDAGNSVLVVEHDEETIRAADHIVDMGPGAGIHGGEIVAAGSPEALTAAPASLTGAYLAGRRTIPVPSRRRPPGRRAIVLTGCSQHNLRDISFRLPLGVLSVVTGVSGSGKSTLVNDTLYRVLAARLHGALTPPGRFRRIAGLDEIDRVIDVDQAPIGRTPRSNAATYVGFFDGIRKLFSQVPEARVRGYGPGRFSFNVKGGRCEACRGDGLIRVEMHFLPDLFVTCETCRGRRYDRETLEILYKARSIADVLEMTVEEALEFMENVPPVRRGLQMLHDVGLDYVRLGQPATTLSGGEAQRIKLAKELSKRSTGRTLYLLDEPTTGLHFADVEKLLEVLNRLVDLGNSVLVIEHHPDVVKSADHVIDLGPEGGDKGGEIVVEGTPEEVAQHPLSHTGRALAPLLFD
ncbi:MAG: excinuclease ABC subunit UvrA [Deltaproteobacteria bacterium]|nr:excinuclease ABC subunit UvrA [Deltaproteobacteria bacterium]